jgi:hypothetical protein
MTLPRPPSPRTDAGVRGNAVHWRVFHPRLILMVIVSRPRASEYSLIRPAAVTPRGTCSGRTGDAPPHPRPVDPGGNKRALKFAGAQRGNVPLMLGNAERPRRR